MSLMPRVRPRQVFALEMPEHALCQTGKEHFLYQAERMAFMNGLKRSSSAIGSRERRRVVRSCWPISSGSRPGLAPMWQIDLLAERKMTAVLQLLRGHLNEETAVTAEQLRDLAKKTDVHRLTNHMAEY
jgi:hypothetical protein